MVFYNEIIQNPTSKLVSCMCPQLVLLGFQGVLHHAWCTLVILSRNVLYSITPGSRKLVFFCFVQSLLISPTSVLLSSYQFFMLYFSVALFIGYFIPMFPQPLYLGICLGVLIRIDFRVVVKLIHYVLFAILESHPQY